MAYHLDQLDPDERGGFYAEEDEEEYAPRSRRVLRIAGALVVMGIFAGGLWFAYTLGMRHTGGSANSGEIPLIHADNRPIKIKPENPGGMQIPDRDMFIYGQQRPEVEHLLPPPEQPMARPAPPPPSPNPPVAANPLPANPLPAHPLNPPVAANPSPAQPPSTAPLSATPAPAAASDSAGAAVPPSVPPAPAPAAAPVASAEEASPAPAATSPHVARQTDRAASAAAIACRGSRSRDVGDFASAGDAADSGPRRIGSFQRNATSARSDAQRERSARAMGANEAQEPRSAGQSVGGHDPRRSRRPRHLLSNSDGAGHRSR